MPREYLIEALRPVCHRSEEVGLVLGIPLPIIHLIQRKHSGNGLCLLNLINYWLSVNRQASWEKLAQALERLQVNGVAADIREKCISLGGKLLK